MAQKTLRQLKPKKVRRKPDGPVRHPDLEALLQRMAEIKRGWEAEKPLFFDLEEHAINLMKKYGITNYDAGGVKASLREPSTEIVDWNMVKSAVGEKVYAGLLDPPQPSKTKLDAAIKLGLIDADVVAEAITEKDNKAYVIAGLT